MAKLTHRRVVIVETGSRNLEGDALLRGRCPSTYASMTVSNLELLFALVTRR